MRGSRLIEEVQAFVDSGQLSEFDAEWIQNLPADKQLASAQKCMKIEPDYHSKRDMQKSLKQKADRKGPFNGSGNGN